MENTIPLKQSSILLYVSTPDSIIAVFNMSLDIDFIRFAPIIHYRS